jgi:hypothetical protein
VNASFLEVALVPFGVVTETRTVPAGSGGETARTSAFERTTKLVAAVDPNATDVTPAKP